MRKMLLFLLISFIGLLVLLVVFRNSIVSFAIEAGVSGVTGFKTSVDELEISGSEFSVQGLKILNPDGKFEEPIFIQIDDFFVNFDLPALLKGKEIHVRELRVNVQEVNILTNKEGVSNIALLQGAIPASTEKDTKPKKEATKPAMPFKVDKLVLTMRKVAYLNKSKIVPLSLKYDLKIDQKGYEGITDPKMILQIITSTALGVIPVGELAPDLGKVKDLFSSSLSSSLGMGKDLIEDQGKVLKEQTSALVTDALQQAGNIISPDAAKDKATKMFGSLKDSLQKVAE